jgi:ubiquitin-protein ligase
MSSAKSARRFAKVMGGQYRSFLKVGNTDLLAVMREEDCSVWYFLAFGLGDPDEPEKNPYLGGEYLFQLKAPSKPPNWFPNYPPSFSFLTPSGVFVPGGPICISIGEFHADDRAGKEGSYGWRPTIGMKGFAREVVNSLVVSQEVDGRLVDPLEGIRINVLPDAKKKKCAKTSRAYNRENHAEIMALFDEFAEAHPEDPGVRAWKLSRGGGGGAGGSK